MLCLLALSSCNTAEINIHYAEVPTDLATAPPIIVVQSWTYGSAEATQAVADGMGEAIPGAVEAGAVKP